MPDLAAHIGALGFSAFPVSAGAFQATPMRHGEDYVGGFFLGGREGGFTGADEETLGSRQNKLAINGRNSAFRTG